MLHEEGADMKDKNIRVNYTGSDGREVIITQDGDSGSIAVYSKAENDIERPFGEPIRKGEWHMEFHAMGDNEYISSKKTAKHYDEQGLIKWYEESYLKLCKMVDIMIKEDLCEEER